MKTFEIEQKYRIQDPARVRNLLRRLGAKKIRAGSESNELFDLHEMLRSQASILRLRRHGNARAGILTFKGPQLKGPYKKRREIETPVDWAAARALLKAAGFQAVAGYSKRREEYSLRQAHVTLDHLTRFGWFLEIEGKPAQIAVLEKKLGFSKKNREERTYLEILGTRHASS